MQRERLGSRLGFLLLSAGCAIGVGNVWKFPWMTGQYGGGAFVLFYLFFLVALGVLVAGDTVLKAGGLLIQPLPGCPDEVIDQIELRSPMFADISREMTFASKEELLEDWFRGMDPVVLERTPLRYHCSCSRHRMEKALISLGRKELQGLIDEDIGAELGCHFCHSQYAFTTQELKELLERASRE